MLKWQYGLAYIGEKTTSAVKTTITEHRYAICNQDITRPVVVHLKKAQHIISTLRYICTENIKCTRTGGDIDTRLLRRELFWFGFIHWILSH